MSLIKQLWIGIISMLLLVEQGVIRFTDLPEAAQNKLLTRRELRGKRQGVYLLDDGDQLPL